MTTKTAARLEKLAAFVLGVIVGAGISSASAQPPAGLYFEQKTSGGGVEVRKMRDTGNGVVCYVTKEATGNVRNAFSVGISCLKEKP